MRSNYLQTMKILLLLVLLSTQLVAAVSVWDYLFFAEDPWELRVLEEEVEAPHVVASFNA